MSETRHTPTARATLAASMTARSVADRAADLVVDVDEHPDTRRIVEALAVERDAVTLRDRVVLRELIAGATYEQVADALDVDVAEARRLYAPAFDLYRARLLTGGLVG